MSPAGPAADSAGGRVPLVDVHAHFVTGGYVAGARAAGHEHPDGMPGWPCWSADEHLRLMDRCGISLSVLSISSPGTHFGDDAAARALTRQVTIESSAGGMYPATPGSGRCMPVRSPGTRTSGGCSPTAGACCRCWPTGSNCSAVSCRTPATAVARQVASVDAAPPPVCSRAAGWRELTTRNAARLFDRTR